MFNFLLNQLNKRFFRGFNFQLNLKRRKMKKVFIALMAVVVTSTSVFANGGNGGDEETIVGVAAGNKDFSTLVAAVKAAGLVETLNSAGPFTVFAPTNAAFDKLPKGTVEGLLKPEAKDKLTAVLTYHVVAGEFNAAAVVEAIKKNKGKFVIKTVQGGTLTASLKGKNVILTDGAGNTSTVVIADVKASNGIIHAIDSVVLPN